MTRRLCQACTDRCKHGNVRPGLGTFVNVGAWRIIGERFGLALIRTAPRLVRAVRLFIVVRPRARCGPDPCVGPHHVGVVPTHDC